MFFNFSKALIKLVRQYWINYHHIKKYKKSIKLVSNRKLEKRLQVTNYEYRSLEQWYVTKEKNDYQSIKCLTSPSKIPDSL